MAEILCLICNETVVFGDICKCFSFGTNDQQYSLPRLDALDQKNEGNIEAKGEYLTTSIDNYSTLCPDFQQIQIKDHENVKSPKNYFFSFSLEKESYQNSSDAISQGRYLKKKDFSSAANFSVNTNFQLISKKAYSRLIEKSEVNLADCLYSYKVTLQPVHGSSILVDKVAKSIGSRKDAKNVLGTFEGHSDCIISRNMKPKIKKTYECDKCREKLFNRRSFIRHYKTHSAKIQTVCGNSQMVISCNDQLEGHKRTETFERPFTCNICEKKFTHNSFLTTHYRIHTEDKPFICKMCKTAFRQKVNLISHYRIHTKEKPFVCNICGKGFCQENGLHRHYPTHRVEKPYECDVCKKGFSKKCDLIRHNRVHTGERPFGCDYCEKRFKDRSNLVVHHRTHTGERPYKCDMCEKRFNRKSNLVSHHRTHTGKKLQF